MLGIESTNPTTFVCVILRYFSVLEAPKLKIFNQVVSHEYQLENN